MGEPRYFGLGLFFFGLFFFIVAVGAIVERFGQYPVVTGVDDDTFYFGAFFSAGVALDHEDRLATPDAQVNRSRPGKSAMLDFGSQSSIVNLQFTDHFSGGKTDDGRCTCKRNGQDTDSSRSS